MRDNLLHKYGAFFARAQQLRIDAGETIESHLTPDNVPKSLHPLLPYAEFWGISDDSYRIELVGQAPADIWRDFREAVSKYKMALLDWLSGPEAGSPPSQEYLAFSYMLQAYDWPRD